MCQPYIESATAFSDKSQETDFHHEAEARKVIADVNFDALYR